MELTPRSLRSPVSPTQYHQNPQNLYEYPSPQSDSRFRSTEPLSDVGLYSCQMSASTTQEPVAVGSGSHVLPSTSTHDWTALQAQHAPRSSQTASNILPAEYDPFAAYHPAVSASYTQDIYSTLPAEVPILPVSPVPSGNASQRSSFSSTPASEIYTQAGSINSYTPSIKMEGEHPDFGTGNEGLMMASPQMSHSLLTSTNSYPGTLEATFYHDQSNLGWPTKVEYTTSQDLPSISSLPIPPYGRRSESQESNAFHRRRGPSTIARTRSPRKLTTKEDANFQCHVKGCGKLFGRSYNFKAHMETHDVSREYPFPCPMKDCNKKFVRKTDLQRHHQSVHMKQRNHRCDFCSRFFARKDTLRRHMEDGCSKRFDIETVDFKPQIYSTGDANPMRAMVARAAERQSRQPSYSSSATSGPHDQPSLTSASGTYVQRDYLTTDNHREPVWSN